MANIDSSLPVRSVADGTDERLHIKIVDGTNPAINQATVDGDSNVHIEVHGDDPSGTDVILRLSEIGALTPDGVYDGTNNTKPGNLGLIASARDASPSDSTQTERITSVTNGDKKLLDISLHDEDGASYSEDNPLPVTVTDAEGAEVHDYQTSASVAVDASVDHTYTVSGTALKLQQIVASASGYAMIEILTGAAGMETPLAKFFNSTAQPNIDWTLRSPFEVAVGNNVIVRITNKENQPQDVYSTAIGYLKLN